MRTFMSSCIKFTQEIKMHCNEYHTKGLQGKKTVFNGYFRRDKNHFVIYLVEQRNLFGFWASDFLGKQEQK